MIRFMTQARDELADRLGRAAEASRALPPHAAELGEALWQTDAGGSAAALGSIGGDIRAIWSEMTTSRLSREETGEIQKKRNTDNQIRESKDNEGEPL